MDGFEDKRRLVFDDFFSRIVSTFMGRKMTFSADVLNILEVIGDAPEALRRVWLPWLGVAMT
jgi:hypothetical protein